MKTRAAYILVGLLAGVGLSYAATNAGGIGSFNAVQTQDIEKIVHNYLVTHPQVLVEAATALEKQQQAQWQATANKAVPQLAQQLFADPQSPIAGNPNGNVTLVEFFDYQCPHCKQMGPQVEDLLKQDKNLRVVFKALPIFGDNSEFAAEAALAAQKQGKFLVFHNALLATEDRLTHEKVLSIAQQVGLNITQLQKDMKNPAILQEIKANYKLASKLDLTGTPGFIIAQVTIANEKAAVVKNPIFIPGAVEAGVLAQAIAEASHGKT